jgi:asparagine synthase (glutamine-hydrolysing)
MFALAVWDGRERVLHLARDRFGIKPLYWCRERGAIGFASEIRALFAEGFPSCRDLDPAELRHYLALGYTSPGGTLLREVRSVAPASVLSIGSDGSERLNCHWQPPGSGSTTTPSFDIVDELRGILGATVERQLVTDVPVGVFLSGGVDSSTVSALAKRSTRGPLSTFSVGFEGLEQSASDPLVISAVRLIVTSETHP